MEEGTWGEDSFLSNINEFHCLHTGVHVALISMRRLGIRFTTAPLFRSISCIVGSGRHVTLINGGNTKGSAVLGVVTKRRRPASNMISISNRSAVKCLPRIVILDSRRAIHRRTRRTFTRVKHVRRHLRQVGRRLTSHASCRDRSCVTLIRKFARRDRHFRVVKNVGCRTRLRHALVNLNFIHRSFSQPAGRFDNK